MALGQVTSFSYDIRADFAASESGFDALRIRTRQPNRLSDASNGRSLGARRAPPGRIDDDEFLIELPERVHAANNAPIRIEFTTDVFVFATTFEGEAIDTATERLPQPIRGGDATPSVSTNSLRVLSAKTGPVNAIQNLRFSNPVLTPNGDRVNDLVQVSYNLFRLPASIPVELRAYSLDGPTSRPPVVCTAGCRTAAP